MRLMASELPVGPSRLRASDEDRGARDGLRPRPVVSGAPHRCRARAAARARPAGTDGRRPAQARRRPARAAADRRRASAPLHRLRLARAEDRAGDCRVHRRRSPRHRRAGRGLLLGRLGRGAATRGEDHAGGGRPGEARRRHRVRGPANRGRTLGADARRRRADTRHQPSLHPRRGAGCQPWLDAG